MIESLTQFAYTLNASFNSSSNITLSYVSMTMSLSHISLKDDEESPIKNGISQSGILSRSKFTINYAILT